MFEIANTLTTNPLRRRARIMMYRLGRFVQLAGMLILPQAIVLELLGKVSLGQSLVIAVVGTAVFIIGVGVQRASGR